MSRKKKDKGIWWLPYVWGLLFIGCWWMSGSFLMGAFYFFIIFCVYAVIFMLCAYVLSEGSRQTYDKRSESYEPASIYDQDLDDEEDFANEAESGDDDIDSYVEDGEINWIDDDDDNADDVDPSLYRKYYKYTNTLDHILHGKNTKCPWE